MNSKKYFSRNRYLFCFLFGLSTVIGCGDDYLRGSVTPSDDGKTYLAIVDDNGGKCGPILVDGKIWEYDLNVPGEISSGIHTIECGTKLEFMIPDSVVFEFDYWGP